MSYYPSKGDWKEVNSRNVCKTCSKDNWCSYIPDGSAWICRREKDSKGLERRDKNGSRYYFHSEKTFDRPTKKRIGDAFSIEPISTTKILIPYTPPNNQAPIAKEDELSTDLVYSTLLSELGLSRQHWQALQDRGFQIEEIAQNRYRSMTNADIVRINRMLKNNNFCPSITMEMLLKTPGFYLREQQTLQFSGPLGTYIPVRNHQGKIKRIKVRNDEYQSKNKYLSLSSKKHGGLGAGSHVHFPSCEIKESGTIRITEGEIKADLATARSGTLTLSFPGISNWNLIVADLERINPKRILVALDADYRKNRSVAEALRNIVLELRGRKYEVIVEDFELDIKRNIKGIDDALAAGIEISEIKEHKLDEFLEQLQRMNESHAQESTIDVTSEAMDERYAADICDSFLNKNGYLDKDGTLLLNYWNERLFRYNGSAYKRMSKTELIDQIIFFLRKELSLRDLARPRFAEDVYANIRAAARLGHADNGSVLLDEIVKSGKTLIPVLNGMIDLTETLNSGASPILVPHNPKIMNFHCLPYEYDSSARCPRWESIMRDFFADEDDTIKLIQEWFGYLLIPDTSFEAMMLLVGDGSNGKSLMINAMAELLGTDNFSAVALEQIRADRTFTLVPMIGKLANIVGEVSEMCKPAQDILKQIVSGDPIAVDEKYDSVMPAVKFYARLVMSSNNPPRFSDRSDGIWRRLITVPFTRKFQEHEKDISLKAPDYWRKSGELAGLFNWALDGLIRLKCNGKFTTSRRVEVEKERYHNECNPAKDFIRIHCEAWTPKFGKNDKRFCVPQPTLYQSYREDSLNNGNQPLSAQQFAKEVTRIFPNVFKGRNPEMYEGSKVRLWKGIRFHRDGFNPEEIAENNQTISPLEVGNNNLSNNDFDDGDEPWDPKEQWETNEPLYSL